MKKCDNPEPDFMYVKDEFDNITFYCVHCGKEVIEIKIKGEKKSKWVHAHREEVIKFD